MPGHLRAAEWEVLLIGHAEGAAFIREHHYAKSCSNTAVYTHGLFCRGSDRLLGVAQWLPPTKVAAQSVNREQWQRVLSLTRLAVHPEVPTNGASFLLSRAIKLIEREQKWASLVTYADEFMNHTGTIYRASNWTYVGLMKAQPRWEDSTGRQVAKKATRTRTKQEMKDLGFCMVGNYRKHKFIHHLNLRKKPLDLRIMYG